METKSKRTFLTALLYMISALAFWTCANMSEVPEPGIQEPATTVQPKPQNTSHSQSAEGNITKTRTPDYYIHTVRWRGETLSLIARWYTGKSKNWRVLAKANPSLNPNRIYKGNQIIIPNGVLKTRKSLPKNFLARLRPKSKKKPISKKTAPEPKKEEPLPLFGPKEYSSNER